MMFRVTVPRVHGASSENFNNRHATPTPLRERSNDSREFQVTLFSFFSSHKRSARVALSQSSDLVYLPRIFLNVLKRTTNSIYYTPVVGGSSFDFSRRSYASEVVLYERERERE